MSCDCEALRAEIQRLRQEVAGVNERIERAQGTADRALVGATVAGGLATAALTKATAADATAVSAASKAVNALGLANLVLNQLQQYVTRQRLTALENRVSVVESGLDILTRLAQTLSNRIAANKRKLDQVVEDMSRLFSQLSALSGRVADLQQQVNRISQRVGVLEAAIEKLRQAIAEIRQIAQRAWDKAIENGRQILILQGLVAANTAAIAVLTAGLFTLGKTVALLSAQVARNFAAIQALAARVARNFAAIQALRTAVEYATNLALEAKSLALSALNKADVAFRLGKDAYQLALSALNKAGFAIDFAKSLQLGAPVDNALLRKLLSLALESRSREAKLLSIANGNAQKLLGSGGGSFDISPCEELEEGAVAVVPYQGDGLRGVYSAIAGVEASLNTIHENTKCGSDGNAALPMHFETRAGVAPQLVISWRPVDGGQSKWSFCIPHPKPIINHQTLFSFPTYKKGNVQFTYVLANNSKVILNAFSEFEGNKILNYVKTLIDPAFISPNAVPKITKGAGQGNLKEVEVRATYIQKFEGHLSEIPLWAKAI
ncbi:MAG: hypothetical protein AAFZ17_22325 [Cyanobacteria bacterium J06650_10]